MTGVAENSGSERLRCPEYTCGLAFLKGEELTAHLHWDHNYSKPKARRKARDVATDSDDGAVAEGEFE